MNIMNTPTGLKVLQELKLLKDKEEYCINWFEEQGGIVVFTNNTYELYYVTWHNDELHETYTADQLEILIEEAYSWT